MANVDDRDNLEIILDGLRQYGGYQKDTAGSKMVPCPFHDETQPSCGISLDVNSGIPLGWFNCLGCGEKGPFNKFAEKTGIDKIKEWNSKPGEATRLVTRDVEEQLLGDSGLTLKSLFKRMNCPEAQEWPEDVEWRGFPGKLIAAVNGKMVFDQYHDSIAVVFPIEMSGRIRGGVKAIYQKTNKKDLSYLTSSGNWVKKYGLFPFAYTKRLMEKRGYTFVVLVEGPRDALRLLYNGIPALAVLGSNNMSQVKAMFILSLGVDAVYVMPDRDLGGDKLWAACKVFLKQQVETKRLLLPEEKVEENGEMKKCDPGNAPVKIIKKLARYLRDNHGYKNYSGYF